MTHAIDLPMKADLFAHLREMVEAGFEDGPVAVSRNGRLHLHVRSLHHSALMTVMEEPNCRFARWAPHPKFGKPPGPRVQALLDARAADDAARKARAA